MRAVAVLVAALLVPDALFAQQVAVIRGRVVAADGRAVPNAAVVLLDQRGSAVTRTGTAADGRFTVTDVRPGTYTLLAEASQQAGAQHVVVRTALPIDLDLTLTPRAAESVVVEGTAQPSAGASITVSGDAFRQLPQRLSSRGLQQLLATLPGFSSEDNGLIHVRGVDDGFLYVEDGVPVHDRVDALFGIARDPADIGSVNVLTGYIPPEFGLKSGAIIEVQSPAIPEGLSAGAETAFGGDDLRSLRASARGGRPSATFGFSLSAEHSDRFLDPVHPANFHNQGDVVSAAAHLTALTSTMGVARITAGAARSRYDVPHGEGQDEAGQDQRQELSQYSLSGSWQRTWSDSVVSQVVAHARTIDASLLGSPADTPVRADSRREQHRLGLLAGITHARGRHTMKAGIETARLTLDEAFTFAVTDAEDAEEAEISDAAAQFTPAGPFVFMGRADRAQWGFYVQDSMRAADAITLDFGVRFDRTNLLVPASQWSPRAGAAWRVGPSTTVRASVNRFFQPPQAEHLLLSSSAAARALSPFAADTDEGGGAELLPERQTAIEAGVEHWLAGTVRADAAFWSRSVRNYADPNVFFGTTIIFPNSVGSGTARGLDLQLQVPRFRGWSSYASYTLSRVEQVGPVNGGLFLEDHAIAIGPGTRFTPDHDQRHVANAGVTYQQTRRGFAASLAARYESGTPLEVDEDDLDELMERPGAELVDFESGRVRPRSVIDLSVSQRVYRGGRTQATARLSILNVANTAYALNFGNPFSGTHFGAPRTLRIDLQIERVP